MGVEGGSCQGDRVRGALGTRIKQLSREVDGRGHSCFLPLISLMLSLNHRHPTPPV